MANLAFKHYFGWPSSSSTQDAKMAHRPTSPEQGGQKGPKWWSCPLPVVEKIVF